MLKTKGEARGFQHFLHVCMVPYLTFLNHSRRSVENNGFAKLPEDLLSFQPECVDYVPLHTLKEHPLWNVLNNDEYFRGSSL